MVGKAVGAVGAAFFLGLGVIAAASSSPPIKVSLVLHAHRVVAGKTIKGTVVFTNTTPHRITVNSCAQNGWLQVGLKGHGYTYEASSLLIQCPPSIRLAPGVNRFSVRVFTTYQSCLQPGGQSLGPIHRCPTSGGLPALPAGRYSTTMYVFGLGGLTQKLPSVTVTLLPAVS